MIPSGVAEPSTVRSELMSLLDLGTDPARVSELLMDMLHQAGSTRLEPMGAWRTKPGHLYHLPLGTRGLAAFRTRVPGGGTGGFRVAAAHTDSPCLRLKTGSVTFDGHFLVTHTEPYGAPILSSLMDMPLMVSGEVQFLHRGNVEGRSVTFQGPMATIPQLAIHMNRDVNKGFAINEHQHMRALCALALPDSARGRPWAWLCARCLAESDTELKDIEAGDILAMDLYLVPGGASTLMESRGTRNFVQGPRIDNLAGCHCILAGLRDAPSGNHDQAAFFFDHEETGSRSTWGADSAQVERILRRIHLASGEPLDEELFLRRMEASLLASVDAAQGWHPNHPEKYDPATTPRLGDGPALKLNARQRYAADPGLQARLAAHARDAGIPLQSWEVRGDMPCGSTIGPLLASLSGMRGVDLGIPILAMHAARELACLEDQEWCIALLKGFYGLS